MKKPTHSLPLKAAAFFLAVLSLAGCLLLAVGSAFLYTLDAYTADSETTVRNALVNLLKERTLNAGNAVAYGDFGAEDLLQSSNFMFTLTGEDGTVLANTYDGSTPFLTQQVDFTTEEYRYDQNEDSGARYDLCSYTAKGYLREGLPQSDVFSAVARLVRLGYRVRYTAVVAAVGLLIFGMACLVFLFCAAGHHGGTDEVLPGPLERIPLDIFIALVALLLCFEAELCASFETAGAQFLCALICGLAGFSCLLALLLSWAVRLKLGTAWHSTCLWRIGSAAFGELKKLHAASGSAFHDMALVPRTALALGVLTLIELIFMLTSGGSFARFFWWAVLQTGIAFVLLRYAAALQKLRAGGERLAAGDLTAQVDASHMPRALRDFAGSLNCMGTGLSKAVEERTKSERFKTELITNVSHDIKTPLTSIINYVDLLKKEQPENEKMREYIEVLDRQSARLKKLVLDLVDASKASTGNLPVHAEVCDVGVLLEQATGEYEERMKTAGLELILHQADMPTLILADGRHLWRIFDNLLNNICKYAQSATRVYLDLTHTETQAVITFRNISRYELNIPSEELMERFVRGDRSRSTEGSGLGLSIAGSLTQLQHGKLSLVIDGDLFKAILTFPLFTSAIPTENAALSATPAEDARV